MSNEFLVVILFTLFGLLAGVLATLLLVNRGRKPVEPQREYPQGLDASQHRSVARLWRELKTGNLLVETDQQIAGSAAELSEKERQELLAAGKEWLRWLSGPAAPVVEPAPAAAPPMREAAPVEASPAVIGTGPLNPQRVVTGTGPLRAVRTPDLDLAAGEKKNTPLTPSRSIVQQVDEILQERIRNSPLNERGIRLSQDLRDGVVIWVGLERYVGLDSVPYPEVTAAVRGAVKEWEETTGQ